MRALFYNVRVYLAGLVFTLFYAGRITLFSYFGSRRLPCYCKEAPRIWSKRILKAAGVKVVVEGAERFDPERAQIVVSNHASWFDVFALAASFPGEYHFVAKQELARIPVFGRAWITCGHIAIDRADRSSALESLDRAAEAIRNDQATIIMFAEGTRSPTGELQRFKKGAFVLALKAGVPVTPVAIVGSRDVMPKGGWRVRPGTIRIRFGRTISVEGMDMADRDALLRRSREAVAALMEAPPRTNASRLASRGPKEETEKEGHETHEKGEA